jgi:hypothetical protein
MGANGMQPDGAARVELVHDSDRARVTRFLLQGRAVIRKQPRGIWSCSSARRTLPTNLSPMAFARGARTGS